SFTASNKVYDGTTAATIASRSLTGVVGQDDVSLTGGTASFGTAAAGTNKTVTGSGFSLGGVAAGNYSLASSTLTTQADVTKRFVTASVSAQNKTYDGTSAATMSGCSLDSASGDTGRLTGDSVDCSASNGQFGSPAAGTGKTVTADVALTGT